MIVIHRQPMVSVSCSLGAAYKYRIRHQLLKVRCGGQDLIQGRHIWLPNVRTFTAPALPELSAVAQLTDILPTNHTAMCIISDTLRP